MIAAEQLCKQFAGAAQPVLDRMSFTVERGSSLAVIGPSGCGKSTLLSLLAGLDTPGSGRVLVGGREIDGPSADTAFILQDFGLLPWKTVRDNVCLGMKIRGVERKRREVRAAKLMDHLGLAERRDAYPATLSGGEKQRVAIARALAVDPEILLMDEPFSSLDTLTREKLQDTLLGLWQENDLTMVLVTHSIEEAVFLGRHILVMGRDPGRTLALLDNPRAGSADYREQEEFFAACKAVRRAVEAGS